MQMELDAPALKEDDWIDVMDGDGIWNVARVLRLPTPETLEVTFDGWGDEYNETLPRTSPRVAPFHTHTWAVKCWAKLETWPWWPALLTVRAPGSAAGSRNLRLEERLLVDFLDRAEFPERCRCWVMKNKVVSFQSDEETRKRLSKIKKKKRKSKGENHVKDMELSMGLLAKCDAREDFPEFMEGTLPVEFRRNFTRPTEEVRKEMGEQIWMKSFADNRINHAATHAYTTMSTTMSSAKNEDEDDIQLPKPAEEKDTATRGDLQTPEEEKTTEAEKEDKANPKEPERPNSGEPQKKKKSLREESQKSRKRARPADDDESSDNTDTSHDAGKAMPVLPGDPSQEQPRAVESVVCETPKDAAENVSNVSTTEDVHIAPRKYGKTPKMLKTPRRSPTNLPLFTPPHARVLLKVDPPKEQHVTRTLHAKQAHQKRPRVQKEKGSTANPLTAVKKSVPSDSKSDDTPASPMKNLARVTKATLRAGKKLHTVEHALEDKLTELAEKSAKAEMMRSKCAGLPIRMHSATSTTSLTTSSETRQISRGDTSRITSRPNVPVLARRSSEAKCGIRGLELALDDQLSRYQILDSAPTRKELDAIKDDLLNSPEVQAALTRIQHPSYGWATAGEPSVRLPSRSSGKTRRAFEKAQARFLISTQPTERGPSPRSPSQQFDRSWDYRTDSIASSGHLQAPSSPLQGPSSPAESSSFGFSVNDNFSIGQWYQDLYPSGLGFQRP